MNKLQMFIKDIMDNNGNYGVVNIFGKMVPSKHCMYSPRDEAVKYCSDCGGSLCRICGYIVDNKVYCNECYEKGF